jgi:HAE1 family hydrophobic/amphiphilic exporter-1
VNQGDAYIRIAPHEERTFSLQQTMARDENGNPLNAFRGNYTQQDVNAGRATRAPQVRADAHRRTQCPLVQLRHRRPHRHRFRFRGPDIVALAGYADDLVARSEKLGGIVDADTTLKLNKPELRVVIDRERAADLGVDTADIAQSLRLMVGGEEEASRFRDEKINEDYDVQLRLTEADRRDADTIAGSTFHLLVEAAAAAPVVRLDNLVKIKRDTSPSRIDRLDRERQCRCVLQLRRATRLPIVSKR